MNRRVLILFAMLVAIGVVVGYVATRQPSATTKTSVSPQPPRTTKTPETIPDQPKELNKEMHSLTDPTSLWIIANKQRRLQPADYIPDDLVVPDIPMKSGITSNENRLRKVPADALVSLAAAAKSEGITLTLQSAYRSYGFQTALYNRYVNEQGQAMADTQSARPGHSEHQTGLAADLGGTTRPACNVEDCYKDTSEGKWLASHAHEYGFIIRYPAGKQPVTGYIYEPWHLRYVGNELAADMHEKGIQTMEEYFGLSAAPDYN